MLVPDDKLECFDRSDQIWLGQKRSSFLFETVQPPRADGSSLSTSFIIFHFYDFPLLHFLLIFAKNGSKKSFVIIFFAFAFPSPTKAFLLFSNELLPFPAKTWNVNSRCSSAFRCVFGINSSKFFFHFFFRFRGPSLAKKSSGLLFHLTRH